MPPLKNVTNKKLPATTTTVSNDKGITTRRRGLLSSVKGENLKDSYVKRKAEASPLLKKTTKRSAFGDITNANDSSTANVANGKKGSKKSTTAVVKPTTTVVKPTTTLVKPITTLVKSTTTVTVRTTRTSSLLKTNNVVKSVKPPAPLPKVSLPMRKPSFLPPTTKPKISVKSKPDGTKQSVPPRNSSGRLSSDLERSDSSLYVSALDEMLNCMLSLDETAPTLPPALPEPEFNIDKENWDDPFQVSIYAQDIFSYLKSRESFFVIKDYIPSQKYITAGMRTLLIDWMAEVQENFEMNHETLYLAVKLVDLYLSKVQILKMNLQLLGAASMLIAAKYDERIPPLIEDFLFICDGAYKHMDMIRMEIQILKTVDFNLGIPLSYRFLRRYARCAKVQMPLLTLARYVLELSLMEYSTIMLSDSKMAAAALYLALKMKNEGEWSTTLHYFSGYAVDDFKDIAIQLNSIIHKKPKQPVSTVRNKYSHKIFFEVAKTPLIDDCEL